MTLLQLAMYGVSPRDRDRTDNRLSVDGFKGDSVASLASVAVIMAATYLFQVFYLQYFVGENSASPLGFSDHQGRHVLRIKLSPPVMGTASVARIPANGKQLGFQRQFAFFQFTQHCQPVL